MKADLSNNDQRIWKELAELGHNGLPVNYVYDSTPGSKGTHLPNVLTADIVINALKKAAE